MAKLSSPPPPPPPFLQLPLPPSSWSSSSSSSSFLSSSERLRILEVKLISIQDLKQSRKKLNTYAMLWIKTSPKFRTRILRDSGPNPTWNDQFLFWVPEDFINCEHSYVEVEIYNRRWCGKELLGTVTALLSTAQDRANHGFVALQVKSPWNEQQAMLNIKMTVWDPSIRYVGDYGFYCGMNYGEFLRNKKINDNDDDDDKRKTMVKADQYSRCCFHY